MRRLGRRRSVWAAMLSAIVLGAGNVLALASCASSISGRPVSSPAVIVMLPQGSAPSLTRAAHVSVGGALDVTYLGTDSPGYWKRTSAGSGSVLRAEPETVTGCESQTPGCPTHHTARFQAIARGRTTVVWTFTGLGPGAPTAGRNVVSIEITVT